MKGLKSRYNRIVKGLRQGRKGFTLIELLIVIAILGVLAAVVIPNISKFTKSGSIAAAKAERQEVQIGVDALMADNGASSLTAISITKADETITLAVGTGKVGTYLARMAGLKGTYYVDNTGTVYCEIYPGLDGTLTKVPAGGSTSTAASDLFKVNGQ